MKRPVTIFSRFGEIQRQSMASDITVFSLASPTSCHYHISLNSKQFEAAIEIIETA